MKHRAYSFGDICKSKVYISFETHPYRGRCFFVGKTYNGTKTGLVVSIGPASVLAHLR